MQLLLLCVKATATLRRLVLVRLIAPILKTRCQSFPLILVRMVWALVAGLAATLLAVSSPLAYLQTMSIIVTNFRLTWLESTSTIQWAMNGALVFGLAFH